MKKIVRLTESDLVRIVKRVISEQDNTKNIPQLNVGLNVNIINQERRTGYMPVNDPDEVIEFYGTVCKIGRFITIKNSKNECLEVINDPKKFYKVGSNTLGIVYFSLNKQQITKCSEWSCQK
jgi:hypothetical protein